MNRIAAVAIALVLLTLCVHAQDAPAWSRAAKTDQLTGANSVEFTLLGKFLAAPNGPGAPTQPTLVARCIPGERSWGRFGGKFLEGYVLVGSVVDTHGSIVREAGIPVRYRLDDGKVQSATWTQSTNYAGVFFSWADFANLLYAHMLPHKKNSSPPVRKVVISIPEFLAADIVAQFDMPEPSEVADACGITRRK